VDFLNVASRRLENMRRHLKNIRQ